MVCPHPTSLHSFGRGQLGRNLASHQSISLAAECWRVHPCQLHPAPIPIHLDFPAKKYVTNSAWPDPSSVVYCGNKPCLRHFNSPSCRFRPFWLHLHCYCAATGLKVVGAGTRTPHWRQQRCTETAYTGALRLPRIGQNTCGLLNAVVYS